MRELSSCSFQRAFEYAVPESRTTIRYKIFIGVQDATQEGFAKDEKMEYAFVTVKYRVVFRTADTACPSKVVKICAEKVFPLLRIVNQPQNKITWPFLVTAKTVVQTVWLRLKPV